MKTPLHQSHNTPVAIILIKKLFYSIQDEQLTSGDTNVCLCVCVQKKKYETEIKNFKIPET